MSLNEIVLGLYLTFLLGGFTALTWNRFNRLEQRMDQFDGRVGQLDHRTSQIGAQMVTREELREALLPLYAGQESMHADMTALRSDLTQVALAVGARPRASGD